MEDATHADHKHTKNLWENFEIKNLVDLFKATYITCRCI